jgi:hypothetical protein
VDTFAGAAETGQEIGRIVGEAGARSSRGDLRSPARLPDNPRGNARHLGHGQARSGSRAFRERPGQGTSLAIDLNTLARCGLDKQAC